MKRPATGDRARPVAAVGSAAVTLLVIALLASIWSPRTRAEAQSADPWSGSRFTSPVDYGTSTNGVFAGTFQHTPPAPISSVDLAVKFSTSDSHPPKCEPAPRKQTQLYETTPPPPPPPSSPSTTEPQPTTTQPPSRSSSVNFSFDFTFICNGIYDLMATARIEDQSGQTPGPLQKSITANAVKVAVAPPSPTAFQAADNGNRTATLSWSPPQAYGHAPGPPPDFLGYRLSRKDASGGAFAEIGTTGPDGLTLTDSSIPPSGGSYLYQVEALRKFAASPPVITAGPLIVSGPTTSSAAGGGAGGATGGGAAKRGSSPQDAGTSGGGATHFDEPTTLAADEGELGAADPLGGVPGGATIQRFGRSGAGLLKPFAAALDLGVWAGLLLFLTRRAAKAERDDRLIVELEHST
jgi:hypothetical protein